MLTTLAPNFLSGSQRSEDQIVPSHSLSYRLISQAGFKEPALMVQVHGKAEREYAAIYPVAILADWFDIEAVAATAGRELQQGEPVLDGEPIEHDMDQSWCVTTSGEAYHLWQPHGASHLIARKWPIDVAQHVVALALQEKAASEPMGYLSWAPQSLGELVLSKIERDPSVRKEALKRYGNECMCCGFHPKVISQLDVHHLFPLSEGGERLTSISDLAVLCANCHRLAHSTAPPLSIEAMKALSPQVPI